MAALPAVVESLENVPEDLRAHYTETDSGFELQVEGDLGTEALSRERRDRKAAEKEAKRLKDTLAKFEGVDLDDIAAMRARVEEMEDAEARARGDWEKLSAKQQQKFEKELGERDGRIEFLSGKLTKVLREDEALREITAEGVGGIPAALLPHVTSRVKLVEEDGDIRSVAIGLDDEETTTAELVAQMKKSGKFDWGFLANGASGGGAAAGSAGGAVGGISSKADLKDPAAHSAFIDEHGLDAYLKLPRES